MSDIRTVLRDVGAVFIMIGMVSLIAIIIPIYFQEYETHTPYNGITSILITSAVFFLVGFPLYYIFRRADQTNFKTAMVTAALSWLFVSFIGSIPFWLVPYNTQTMATMDILSGFFESMSGWTGTGLTMVDNETLLPYTLQFWRTFIQWIGGVGVIVLTLSILARPGTGSYLLYRIEGREQRTHPSVVSTVRTIWWIYLLYTIIGILLLVVIGLLIPSEMNAWESLNHAMCAISTGGFSVTDDSITGFGWAGQLIIIILMILGSIAFVSHYDLLKGRFKKFFGDPQNKALILIILVGVLILTLINVHEELNLSLITSELPIAAFQFISAITCTGFQTVVSFAHWSESALLLLSFAMIVGGAAGSTAGGIKLFRAILLYKGVGWRIKRAISSPRRVFVHKLGEKSLTTENAIDLINEAAIISFIWVVILFASILFLSELYPDHTLGTIIFEVCSAQGNVGLSAGITQYGMYDSAKGMLIFNMWIGRLEIIPVIVLIRSIFGIRRNLV